MRFRNSNQMCVKLFSCAERIRSNDLKDVNMHQCEDKHVMEKRCCHDNSVKRFFYTWLEASTPFQFKGEPVDGDELADTVYMNDMSELEG